MAKTRRTFWLLGICAVPIVLWLGFKAWQWAVVPAGNPVIGLSSDTAWHGRIGLSNTTYQVALNRAGANLFEFLPGDASADEIIDTIDGLVIAGGFDVNPKLYGGNPEDADHPDDPRDALETELIRKALDRNMPVLGICRGVQIINVAHGGSLRSLRKDPKLGPAHGGRLEWSHAHEVFINPDSLLAEIDGAGLKGVNSFHGQGIDRVGEGLRVAAKSTDGVIEAVEHPNKAFVIGVQWHPEMLSLEDPQELGILEELVAQAAIYRSRTSAGSGPMQGHVKGGLNSSP